MSWDWVPPVEYPAVSVCSLRGWPGAQGRAHAERTLRRTREAERQMWLLRERRDAYLAALRVIDLDMRRAWYKRDGKMDKLEQLDRFWPKGERVRMSMEALIGVNTFGSDRARAFAAEWAAALEADDEAAPVRAAEQTAASRSAPRSASAVAGRPGTPARSCGPARPRAGSRAARVPAHRRPRSARRSAGQSVGVQEIDSLATVRNRTAVDEAVHEPVPKVTRPAPAGRGLPRVG
jgi:hypothetical protein